jgi:hypothetical protein
MVLDCTASLTEPGSMPQLLQAGDLVVARLGFDRARARSGELIVEVGQLLLVHPASAGADDALLGLVALGFLLRPAHALLQLRKPRRQRFGDAARGFGMGSGLLPEIGLHDGVGETRGLVGIGGLDRQVDHVGALRPLGGHVALQLPQRTERAFAGRLRLGGEPKSLPDLRDELLDRRLGAGIELGIAHQSLGLDHALQDLVRGQNARLALDLDDVGVRGLRRRYDRFFDAAQVDRADQDLARRTIARRERQLRGHVQKQRRRKPDIDPSALSPDEGQVDTGTQSRQDCRRDRPHCLSLLRRRDARRESSRVLEHLKLFEKRTKRRPLSSGVCAARNRCGSCSDETEHAPIYPRALERVHDTAVIWRRVLNR